MLYVAQAIPQIDAEIAENGHFWMKTSYLWQIACCADWHQ